MLSTMPAPKKKAGGKKPANPNNVFLRVDDVTASALGSYIAKQEVPPERTTVIITALRHFLAERGFLPKPKN
jgi:hypothetical protein